jgi:hypothetical protein
MLGATPLVPGGIAIGIEWEKLPSGFAAAWMEGAAIAIDAKRAEIARDRNGFIWFLGSRLCKLLSKFRASFSRDVDRAPW